LLIAVDVEPGLGDEAVVETVDGVLFPGLVPADLLSQEVADRVPVSP
jgi:hypothetical protein